MSHWYDNTGKLILEIPKANPKNGMKKTTVGDARKLGFYPSVTTIISQIKSSGLEMWSTGLFVKQCYNNPPKRDESEDAYKSRISRFVSIDKSVAPELGTAIHNALETFLRNGKIIKEYAEYVLLVDEWLNNNKIIGKEYEKSIDPSACGYGGTVDFLGYNEDFPIILDFKTKKTKGKKISQYDGNNMQLVAYKKALSKRMLSYQNALLINMYISTDEAGRVESYTLTEDDEVKAWRQFSALYKYFCATNFKPII